MTRLSLVLYGCDGDPDNGYCDAQSPPEDGTIDAWLTAEMLGWTRQGDLHFCPEHSEPADA